MNSEFYDAYYSDCKTSKWREAGAKAKSENIEALVGHNHNYEKVLEVGCGEGSVLEVLSTKYSNWKLYGCDVSENALAITQKRGINNLKELFVCDFTRFPENYFDLIIITHVLEHVPEPQKLLIDIKRIGRNFLFEVPLEDNLNAAKLRKILCNYAERIGHINFFNRNSFKAILKQSGFLILKERIATPPLYVSSFYSSSFVGKFKELLKYSIKRSLLRFGFESRFTYHYTLLCKKGE
jgi:ubiquinone/menaquinone biosynthesis C-methylase UbiE